MSYYFIGLVVIILCRLYLFQLASKNAVDQYFWLNYRDTVMSLKQMPPELPQYLLEFKQWYPPFFGWFLSKLPNPLFKHSTFLILMLSLLRFSLIGLFFYCTPGWQGSGFVPYLVLIVYVTAPVLVYYDNQINSRIFGALIVDLLILLLFLYFEYHNPLTLPPLFLLTIVLLFTHKMSHQLYIFLLVGVSVCYLSFIPLLVYGASTIIAFSFNYKNYLKHHIEIVLFWHRNRYKLGAHQFYESKIYGKDGFVYGNRLHGFGIKSFIKKIALIVGMLPFVIFIMLNFEFNFFGMIVFMTLLFIFLTSFVDYFLCLGAGSLYTYNLTTFAGFYLLTTDIDFSTLQNQLLLILTSAMTLYSIFKFYRGLVGKNELKNDQLEEAISFFKNSTLDRVLVIPFQLPDEISYKTGKKVFWGGHGYGFKILEPYFPVFNQKIETAIKDWNLGAVFLQKSYWPEFFDRVDMELFDTAFENEQYAILAARNFNDFDKMPDWAIAKYPDIFKS